jgi:hypothetical protein
MNVLVLNCGRSSVKFQLIATDLERIAANTDVRLARGVVERIGGEAIITLQAEGSAAKRSTAPLRDTRAAVELIIRWVTSEGSGIAEVQSVADVHAVGHRVVHGGEQFTHSVLITEEVLRGIEDCIDLAPLHNPANLNAHYGAPGISGTGPEIFAQMEGNIGAFVTAAGTGEITMAPSWTSPECQRAVYDLQIDWVNDGSLTSHPNGFRAPCSFPVNRKSPWRRAKNARKPVRQHA